MTSKHCRSALITGASKRLGKAMAEHLHGQGYRIFVHYHQNEQAANQFSEQLNQTRAGSALTIQANLQDPEQIDFLIQTVLNETDTLDVLINNASQFFPDITKGQNNDTSTLLANWQTLVQVNATASYHLTVGLRKALKVARGCVINMVDIYATRPLSSHTLYSTSKAANAMLVKSMALELAPDIRVNGISPGAILWPESADKNQSTYQQTLLKKIPLGRIGNTDSIVQTMQFLIDCDYLCGQIISVDGGRSLNM